MRPFLFSLALVLGGLALRGDETAPAPANWSRVNVAPMKTSIYVGSVRLATGVFERQGSRLTATYEAKVVPWFFWSENGRIAITLSDGDFARLARRETIEFTGSAMNQKNKPRSVTGRAQPADASSGRIKVRIKVDGIELIFNGTYELTGGKP